MKARGSLHGPSATTAFVAIGGLLGLPAIVSAFLWAVDNVSYDLWGAFIIGPSLLILTIPLARHLAKIEGDPLLVKIIMWALVLKLLAALVRYFVAFEVYGGSADAAIYIREGKAYAESLRAGVFTYVPGSGGGEATFFIRRVSGVVFFLIGPTAIGGFLVFSWLSFWGLYFFYRSFRIGVPHGDHRRYAFLVFFVPTLLFWPSSIGKDAWMILTIGLAAYGGARVLTHLRGGYLLLALGLTGTLQVREHMAVLVAASLVVSFLIRRAKTRSPFGPAVKVVGGALVMAALFFTVSAAQERFGVEGGLTGAEQALDETAEQTSKGGSEFEARRPETLMEVPSAIFTVVFRPLPHEAHNAQAMVTSLEGVFLLGLFASSVRRMRPLVREVWRTPYLMFAALYSLLFVFAFSSFGNFGILARQRAQLFPLMFMLLALPTPEKGLGRTTSTLARVPRSEESLESTVLPLSTEPEV